MRLLTIGSIGLAVALGSACGGDSTVAPHRDFVPTPTPTTPPPPSVVSLVIQPESVVTALGTGFTLTAMKLMSDGTRAPANAVWGSLGAEIVTIDASNGYASAVGPGRAMIKAQWSGLSAVVPVVVLAPKSVGFSDALIVERFWMNEFQYPSAPDRWFYAPQVRVRAGPGHRVTILTLSFGIPGLGPAPGMGCGGTIGEAPRELNGEVYGDWLYTIDSPGHQATAGLATAVITYTDETGTLATGTIEGPVERGTLPTSYTGGQNGGPCFHGYGSGGLRAAVSPRGERR